MMPRATVVVLFMTVVSTTAQVDCSGGWYNANSCLPTSGCNAGEFYCDFNFNADSGLCASTGLSCCECVLPPTPPPTPPTPPPPPPSPEPTSAPSIPKLRHGADETTVFVVVGLWTVALLAFWAAGPTWIRVQNERFRTDHGSLAAGLSY